MSLVLALFIYLLVWWVMLFTMLPLGVERDDISPPGADPGAPRDPQLKKKLILTTAVSAVIVLVMHVLVEIGVIRWADWFSQGF